MKAPVLMNFNIEVCLNGITPENKWAPVAFKVDGERFPVSNNTVKLYCDRKYKIGIKINPPLILDSWWIDVQQMQSSSKIHPCIAIYPPQQFFGSELEKYDYVGLWNTEGVVPSAKGHRNVVNLFFQGNEITVSKPLQCKFYAPGDWHAEYGHLCTAIAFDCAISSAGEIYMKSEKFKLDRDYCQRRKLLRSNTC